MDKKDSGILLEAQGKPAEKVQAGASITPSVMVDWEVRNITESEKIVLCLLKDTSPALSEEEYLLLDVPSSTLHLQSMIVESLRSSRRLNNTSIEIKYFLLSEGTKKIKKIVTESNIRSLIRSGVLVLATSRSDIENVEFECDLSLSILSAQISDPTSINLDVEKWVPIDGVFSILRERVSDLLPEGVELDIYYYVWGRGIISEESYTKSFHELELSPQDSFKKELRPVIPFLSEKLDILKYQLLNVGSGDYFEGSIDLEHIKEVREIKFSVADAVGVGISSVHIQFNGAILKDEQLISSLVFPPNIGIFANGQHRKAMLYITNLTPPQKEPREVTTGLNFKLPRVGVRKSATIYLTWTLGEVKKRIKKELLAEHEKIELIYTGQKLLYDELPFSLYGVREDSTVNVVPGVHK